MIIALPGAVVKLFAFVILHKIFPEHIHAQTPRADQVAPASARPRILIHGLRVFIHLYSKKIPVRKSVSLPEGCPESLIPWAVLASPLSTHSGKPHTSLGRRFLWPRHTYFSPAWARRKYIFGLSAFAYTPFCRGLPSCEGRALSSRARGMLTAHGMRLF